MSWYFCSHLNRSAICFDSVYVLTVILTAGGTGEENVTACIKVCYVDLSQDMESLRCSHEEGDDRMMFHIHQVITTDDIERVIIASGDTDDFVCSICHFSR